MLNVQFGTPVVTRSFDSKPTVTTATSAREGVVLLGNAENPDVLRFPSSDVFKYDEKLVALLERAFRSGDSKKLESLWRQAVPLAE